MMVLSGRGERGGGLYSERARARDRERGGGERKERERDGWMNG